MKFTFNLRIILIIIFLLSLLVRITYPNYQQELDTNRQKTSIKILYSGDRVINYGEGFAIHGDASNKVRWSYQSSAAYITVRIMDRENFSKFQGGNPHDYTQVANGTTLTGSGSYKVPYKDTWYVVYMNLDYRYTSTSIHWEVHFDPESSTNLKIPGYSALSIILIAIFLCSIMILHYYKK